MVGCTHRTHRFARRSFALLAQHRHELCTLMRRINIFVVPIALDTNPMHYLTMQKFFLADYWQVVLCIARHYASIAASARVKVNRHCPFVFWVVFIQIACWVGGTILRPIPQHVGDRHFYSSLKSFTLSAAMVATILRSSCVLIMPGLQPSSFTTVPLSSVLLTLTRV